MFRYESAYYPVSLGVREQPFRFTLSHLTNLLQILHDNRTTSPTSSRKILPC